MQWGWVSVTECSQPEDIKPKIRSHELRIGVYRNTALKQKPCKTSGAQNKPHTYCESKHLQICDKMGCVLLCWNRTCLHVNRQKWYIPNKKI